MISSEKEGRSEMKWLDMRPLQGLKERKKERKKVGKKENERTNERTNERKRWYGERVWILL